MVNEIHLPLVKLFRNNLNRGAILSLARHSFDPSIDRIGRVVERFDYEKYRVARGEGDAISSYQFLDALAREPGRDMQESVREGMRNLLTLDPIADAPRQQARVIDPVSDHRDRHADSAVPDRTLTVF